MELIDLVQGKGYVMAWLADGSAPSFSYKIDKTEGGATRVYLITPMTKGNIYAIDDSGDMVGEGALSSGSFVDVVPGMFGSPTVKLFWGAACHGSDCKDSIPFETKMGGAYVLNTETESINELVRPNSVNLLWAVPQYVVITIGEVLLSITGLEFAYSQASPDMKSVLQALWLLTVFAGNVIAGVISGSNIIPWPSVEFFFYAALMVLVMGVFIFLAMRYTYAEDVLSETEESEKEEEEGKSQTSEQMSYVDLGDEEEEEETEQTEKTE